MVRKAMQMCVAAMAVLVMAGSANAAILSGLALDSSGNYQWPSETLIGGIEQTSATVDASSGHDIKSNRDQGQSFTITQTGTLGSVAFNFEAFNSGGSADFTLNFFKVVSASDSTQVGPTIDSLTVSAADIAGLGFSNGDQGTLVFDIADTSVTAGEVYAIQLDTDNDSNLILKWRRDNTGSYTDGESFGNSTAAPDYYAAAYAVVPEPASLALLGLGGVVALVRRRR